MATIAQCLPFVGRGMFGLMHPVVVVQTAGAVGVRIVDHTAGNLVDTAVVAAHKGASHFQAVPGVGGTALAVGWIGSCHTDAEHLLKNHMIAAEQLLGQSIGSIPDENCCDAVAVLVSSWQICWQTAAAAGAKASCSAAGEMADLAVARIAAVAWCLVAATGTADVWIVACTTYEVDFRLRAENLTRKLKEQLLAPDSVFALNVVAD